MKAEDKTKCEQRCKELSDENVSLTEELELKQRQRALETKNVGLRGEIALLDSTDPDVIAVVDGRAAMRAEGHSV